MQIFDSVQAIRRWSDERQARRVTVGLVATMGALHRGHQRLIEASVERCQITVVSIFVNPLQFGPNEDFLQYPRTMEEDVQLARSSGASVIFAPSIAEMYPEEGGSIQIDIGALGQVLCGRTRPTHFAGVATVVTKLFNLVQPTDAFFGAKDGQQVAVIERLVHDLNIPVAIHSIPTVREPDGLAISSRNRYLTLEQRTRAAAIARGLFDAKALYGAGERHQSRLIDAVKAALADAGIDPEYVELRSWNRLEGLPEMIPDTPVMLAAAARIGKSRLIDNVILEKDSTSS
ncbi:MAG: pantoate--beta-alanine ligase [Firmicutes bacterium]|jgi:pantoate--beta-alanine ligase|nr:pantoate--beta-alanine ligase [Bacillota bacterium]MCL5064752.1 pantoate--beta-alanine ligase [Bacillota bacterium]